MPIVQADLTNADFYYPRLASERNDIRLLSINCLDFPNEAGLLSCSLVTVPLKSRTPYIALSYMWGRDQPNKTILVNGAKFKIRPNLYTFLTTLGIDRYWGRNFFIDAICINQVDLEERTRQVALMGTVYTDAARVVGWLGSRKPGFPAFIAGTFSPFWTRLWIVQELTLARKLTLYVGDTMLDLQDLSSWLYDHGYDTWNGDNKKWHSARLHPSRHGEAHLGFEHIAAILGHRRRFGAGCVGSARLKCLKVPMYRALMAFELQQCHEPRDIVFGLLGIARSQLVPDLKIAVHSLYLYILLEGLQNISQDYPIVDDRSRREDLMRDFMATCLRAFGFSFWDPTIYHIGRVVARHFYGPLGDKSFELDPRNFKRHWAIHGAEQSIRGPGHSLLLSGSPKCAYIEQWSVGIQHFLVGVAMPGIGFYPLSTYGHCRVAILENILDLQRIENEILTMPDGTGYSYHGWENEVERMLKICERGEQPVEPPASSYLVPSLRFPTSTLYEAFWIIIGRTYQVLVSTCLASICDGIALRLDATLGRYLWGIVLFVCYLLCHLWLRYAYRKVNFPLLGSQDVRHYFTR